MVTAVPSSEAAAFQVTFGTPAEVFRLIAENTVEPAGKSEASVTPYTSKVSVAQTSSAEPVAVREVPAMLVNEET